MNLYAKSKIYALSNEYIITNCPIKYRESRDQQNKTIHLSIQLYFLSRDV